MKYIIVISNKERLEEGEEDTLESVTEDVKELLCSGYYKVKSVKEAPGK